MSTDKLNVGQELVERLQNFNDNIDSIMNKQENQIQSMLDAIRSAEVDILELPEITDKNKSNVKPKKLPKK